MNTCTRRTEFAKQSTVALGLWVSIEEGSHYTCSENISEYREADLRLF